MSFPSSDWISRYVVVVNGDTELRLVGGFLAGDVAVSDRGRSAARSLIRLS